MYTPENLLERWRAANAQRMGPLLVVADMNYAFQDMYASAEWYFEQYNVKSKKLTHTGIAFEQQIN